MRKRYRPPKRNPKKINVLVKNCNSRPFYEIVFLTPKNKRVLNKPNLLNRCLRKPPRIKDKEHRRTIQYIMSTGCYLFSETQPHRFFIQNMDEFMQKVLGTRISVDFWGEDELETLVTPSDKTSLVQEQIQASRQLKIIKRVGVELEDELFSLA